MCIAGDTLNPARGVFAVSHQAARLTDPPVPRAAGTPHQNSAVDQSRKAPKRNCGDRRPARVSDHDHFARLVDDLQRPDYIRNVVDYFSGIIIVPPQIRTGRLMARFVVITRSDHGDSNNIGYSESLGHSVMKSCRFAFAGVAVEQDE